MKVCCIDFKWLEIKFCNVGMIVVFIIDMIIMVLVILVYLLFMVFRVLV